MPRHEQNITQEFTENAGILETKSVRKTSPGNLQKSNRANTRREMVHCPCALAPMCRQPCQVARAVKRQVIHQIVQLRARRQCNGAEVEALQMMQCEPIQQGGHATQLDAVGGGMRVGEGGEDIVRESEGTVR